MREQLIDLERRYGGYVSGVKRRRVSPHDRRTRAAIKRGGMIGGDRFDPARHGYADAYARFLPATASVIVEMGILRGTGLAVWCDLYPCARVIGLDVDLSHVTEWLPEMRRAGAFARNKPELYEFDELVPDAGERLAEILNGQRADVFIDDALHDDESILTAWRFASPHLAPGGVYIIEDNHTVAGRLPSVVHSGGGLTICSPS